MPNFIEVANGYESNRNDCAPERCGAAEEGADFLTQERNALLILDSTGSMAARQQAREAAIRLEELQRRYFELREQIDRVNDSRV